MDFTWDDQGDSGVWVRNASGEPTLIEYSIYAPDLDADPADDDNWLINRYRPTGEYDLPVGELEAGVALLLPGYDDVVTGPAARRAWARLVELHHTGKQIRHKDMLGRGFGARSRYNLVADHVCAWPSPGCATKYSVSVCEEDGGEIVCTGGSNNREEAWRDARDEAERRGLPAQLINERGQVIRRWAPPEKSGLAAR